MVLFEILKHTLMITSFVLVMMMVIEYITVQTQGKWNMPLRRSGWLQVVVAAVLGIIPGCLGTFTAVSLYSHRMLSFAALVAVMIATTGDDIFFMFSTIPNDAIILSLIVFVIAIVSGLIVRLFMKDRSFMVLKENFLKFHTHEPECHGFEKVSMMKQLRNISFHRAILLTVGALFLIFQIAELVNQFQNSHSVHEHVQEIHQHGGGWEGFTFLLITTIGLIIIAIVPEHFLIEHLWKHTIKKHLVKIFLWTFGAFFVIHFLNQYLNIEEWIKANLYFVLLIAVLVGIIPESGPHIFFITLFANGSIPFIILIANSIVQDGHGAIPLLAESRRSFVFVKLANVAVGLLVGIVGLLFL